MTDQQPIGSPQFPPNIAMVRGAFEAAWREGKRPAIEQYLGSEAKAARSVLLRELLRLELALRMRANERPSLEEYSRRFPEERQLILAVFADTPTATTRSGSDRWSRAWPADGGAADSLDPWPAVPGYEIEAALPPGGMGVVYRARQIELNRVVALKMLRSGPAAGPEERARFRLEAEAVASLSHPHIVQIHDFGDWNGVPYLAMEFVEGGSLAQYLGGRCAPSADAAKLIETLARAVHLVHLQGIVHRDLKPGNILLQKDEGRRMKDEKESGKGNSGLSASSFILHPSSFVPKITDFGLAKRLDRDQGLTLTHAVLGTASYMSPEQASGNTQAIGPATDVYGLGAILYELLTGRPPFEGETRELTIQQVLFDEPVPPAQLQPEISVELEAICLKCLEKDPGERFTSALALAEDLRRYQAGEPLSIRPWGPFEWHARLARRAGYEILELLCAHVRGLIYKARQVSLNRIVCLEVSAARHPPDAARRAEVQAEAEAAARLHHPNIVELYDFGELGGLPYLAREFVEGICLFDKSAGPLQPTQEAALLVETLARALHHAHLQGLVHGALRPSKIIIGLDGITKITGFGLASLALAGPAQDKTEGCYANLSGYMAPEQAASPSATIGPAADVYALGALLYYVITGRPPVLADNLRETLDQVRLGNIEPPRYWRPELPAELDAICLKCLEKQPAQRYPSAAALAEDLRRFRHGEVLSIDDLDEWTQQERWARRAGYEVLEQMAAGPEAFTYRARRIAADQVVVLKRLSAQYRFVPMAKTWFRRQAQSLGRLNHPHIAKLYELGEQNDIPFFAREFVDGPSLAEKSAQAPLDCRLAAKLVESLAITVHSAHEQGIIHGGLHPGRVHVSSSGVPKITSLRRTRLPKGDADIERPMRGSFWPVAYLAPEQLERRRWLLSPTIDVYALGAILYTLMTGQPPFAAPTASETLDMVQNQLPVPPRRLIPTVDVFLDTFCLKCLQKVPTLRPPSAKDLGHELRGYLGGLGAT